MFLNNAFETVLSKSRYVVSFILNCYVQFKAKFAIEAIKGKKTVSELSSLYRFHRNQISKWKKQALKSLPDVFSQKHKWEKKDREALEDKFYMKIGKLKVELGWLKKRWT